jgi:hypothetical protein
MLPVDGTTTLSRTAPASAMESVRNGFPARRSKSDLHFKPAVQAEEPKAFEPAEEDPVPSGYWHTVLGEGMTVKLIVGVSAR